MTQMSRWAASAVVACLVLLSGASVRAADDKETITTKGEKGTSAATIDFGAELGLSFASLKGLGLRIDQARSAPDPVGLAVAARELAVAEKVSGKTAKITAADLMKEAVQMVQRRLIPEELKALALLVHDKAAAKELTEAAAKAQAMVDARKSGEKPRGIEGRLYVNNKTAYYVRVYVDSRYVGTVDPYSTSSMYVGAAPFTDTVLYAQAPGTSIYWPTTRVSQRVRNYYWNLN